MRPMHRWEDMVDRLEMQPARDRAPEGTVEGIVASRGAHLGHRPFLRVPRRVGIVVSMRHLRKHVEEQAECEHWQQSGEGAMHPSNQTNRADDDEILSPRESELPGRKVENLLAAK